jgi:hypothetical protein
VVNFDTGHDRVYSASGYTPYFQTDETMFPVLRRTERRPDLKNKDKIIVLVSDDMQKAYPVMDILESNGGLIEDTFAGRKIRFTG